MAKTRRKRQKQPKLSLGPQPFREARRKGHAYLMHATANIIHGVIKYHLQDARRELRREHPDYNLYETQELRVLEKVCDKLEWCERALNAIGRSMARGSS